VKYLRDEEGIKKFGQKLREVRIEKGFSQEDLAFASCLTLSQVGRIERGVINTSLSTAFVLARVLKVDLKYLFDFELPPFERIP
jgi:transcriptional regulator with XRE-family HTH domain